MNKTLRELIEKEIADQVKTISDSDLLEVFTALSKMAEFNDKPCCCGKCQCEETPVVETVVEKPVEQPKSEKPAKAKKEKKVEQPKPESTDFDDFDAPEVKVEKPVESVVEKPVEQPKPISAEAKQDIDDFNDDFEDEKPAPKSSGVKLSAIEAPKPAVIDDDFDDFKDVVQPTPSAKKPADDFDEDF